MSKENLSESPIILELPNSTHGSSAKGRYKYEVRDAEGVVYDSGGWKPNLILDCGLDKLADMPWAQTFQWSVAGTDPTPTVDKYEDTRLQVKIVLDATQCPNLAPGDVHPCDDPPPTLKAIATAGCRQAPMEPYWHDAYTNKPAGNVPSFALDHARSFGRVTDTGKTLFLRDQNLQYKVLSSCPQYTVIPQRAEGFINTVDGQCSTLSGANSWPAPGNGFTLSPGMGYLSGGKAAILLSPGDPNAQIILPTGINPLAGIKVEPPQGTGAKGSVQITSNTVHTGLQLKDINITDKGDGYSSLLNTAGDACPNGSLTAQVAQPIYPANQAWWNNGVFPAWVQSDNDDNLTSSYVGSDHYYMQGGWSHSNFASDWQGGNFEYVFGVNGYSADYDRLLAQLLFIQYFVHSHEGNKSSQSGSNALGFSTQLASTDYHNVGATASVGPNDGTGQRALRARHMPENPTSGTYSIANTQAAAAKAIDNFSDAAKLQAAIKANGISMIPVDTVHALVGGAGWQTIDVAEQGDVINWVSNIQYNNFNRYDRMLGGVYKNGAYTQGELEPNTNYNITVRKQEITAGIFALLIDPLTQHPAWSGVFHNRNMSQATSRSFLRIETDGAGLVVGIGVNVRAWIDSWKNTADSHHHSNRWSNPAQGIACIFSSSPSSYSTISPSLPGQLPATLTADAAKGSVDTVAVSNPGRGYSIGEKPTVTFSGPKLEQATMEARVDTNTGSVSSINLINPGSGYSETKPVRVFFPEPPPQQIKAYDLLIQPVQTYENVNNDFYYLSNGVPIEGPCDVYHTDQTYLGQGKPEIGPGHLSIESQGGHQNRGDKYGRCHYFDPGIYDTQELMVNTGHTKVTHNQYKTHGWYVTGTDFETNSVYCGTDWLSSGNQVSLTRTFDYYMELQPVTYTEVGFKEAPSSRELFSRIVLDDPIRLRAGQYLRLAYQLLVTLEPGGQARYREVPSEGTWFNGTRTRVDANTNESTTINVLTGYECIQGNGIAIVDENGIAIPHDITGVANEPYAPGSYMLGPQYGYVNRWKNGDTRLSYPTREYNNDINNPWILGGDQHSPPDWGIKFFDSPTGSYRPRDFKTFLEWPQYKTSIVDYSNQNPGIPTWVEYDFPPGPEITFERDAFVHWFTQTMPNNTSQGTATWTSFVAGKQNNKGRWDYHVTKPYIREVYPNLMKEPHMYGLTVKDSWYNKYRYGDTLANSGTTPIRSAPGVFMGPIINYDGDEGALVDPTSTSTTIKNPLSHTGGMGMITRAAFLGRNPYTGTVLEMLEPNNTGWSGNVINKQIPTGCLGGVTTYNTPMNHWCWNTNVPVVMDGHAFGPLGLIKRLEDYHMSSIKYKTTVPNRMSKGIEPSFGGGFSTLDSWKTWTHTPNIDYKTGITVDSGTTAAPDTAGNWSMAESIPVAGASAFISTSKSPFMTPGEYFNLSHTLFGAVSGNLGTSLSGNPEHDFDGTKSIAAFNAGLITNQQKVNAEDRCFETPLMLNDYNRGDHKREKYAEWETTFGNLTGVSCIGIGPTSTTLNPLEMTDAARFNTYVFKFDGQTLPWGTSYDNLTTFKLKTTFQHTWYRDLS